MWFEMRNRKYIVLMLSKRNPFRSLVQPYMSIIRFIKITSNFPEWYNILVKYLLIYFIKCQEDVLAMRNIAMLWIHRLRAVAWLNLKKKHRFDPRFELNSWLRLLLTITDQVSHNESLQGRSCWRCHTNGEISPG